MRSSRSGPEPGDRAAAVPARADGSTPTPPWAEPSEHIASELRTDTGTGLRSADAAARLESDGPNLLAESPPPTLAQRFLAQFTDPLVGLLLAAIVVSLLAWWSDGADEAPVESIVIALIVVANAVIGVWQEGRAIDAVAALRQLTSVQSTVIRDGRSRTLPSEQLVVGDLIVLAEGDAVSADARLSETHDLEVSEAPLTGESLPVAKSVLQSSPDAPVADRTCMVHSGTAVTKGRARAIVTATGDRTEVGRIAELLGSAEVDRTPLQRQIDQLSRWLGVLVLVLAAAVIGAIFVTSDVSTASDAFDALMVAVSLAVAAVPEGLPAILTVVLALGVQRMAGHNAIVKRLLSVETLGAASVICTDKTGTLTRNEMTVVRVAVAGATADVSGVGYERDGVVRLPPDLPEPIAVSVAADVEELLRGGAAANDASLGEEWSRTADDAAHSGSGAAASSGDPTELALLVAAHKSTTTSTGSVRPAERLPVRVGELAFDSDRKLMSTLHEAEDDAVHGAPHVQFTKGAPDVVLTRCGAELDRGDAVPLTDDRRARIQATIDSFADDGLRTLAVARRAHLHGPSDFSTDHEHDLTLLGVVGIADPAKREVIPVIAEAHRAGVHTVMVTGDHPRTARAIGASLGLNTTDEAVVTGDDLASGALDDRIEHATVFARVAPEDKLRIVDAYQDAGRIVAMTGDGVNDAPALRHADIGVAMGRGGTEVARDAADMILADDDFRTIVRAIREGRELFADIRKFLRYLLASNTGEVLVMILGVLAASPLALDAAEEGLAVPLLATQILWINLLTDSALALALGVDPSVDDVMADRPRALDEPIIDRSMWVTIVLVGTTTAVAGLVALDLELAGGMLGGDGDLVTARTMLFTTVVLAQVFNAFNSRSDRVSAFRDPFANRLLWLAVVVTVVLQVAVVHVPTLNRAFDTTPLDLGRWLICFALASCVLIVDEIRKAIARVRRGPTVDVVM